VAAAPDAPDTLIGCVKLLLAGAIRNKVFQFVPGARTFQARRWDRSAGVVNKPAHLIGDPFRDHQEVGATIARIVVAPVEVGDEAPEIEVLVAGF
jgi:hypothetical protein